MKTTLTITSKGQTTLPIALRRKLHVENGGSLVITYNAAAEQAVISKPMSAKALGDHFGRYVAPGTTPVTDANAYYQANRKMQD